MRYSKLEVIEKISTYNCKNLCPIKDLCLEESCNVYSIKGLVQEPSMEAHEKLGLIGILSTSACLTCIHKDDCLMDECLYFEVTQVIYDPFNSIDEKWIDAFIEEEKEIKPSNEGVKPKKKRGRPKKNED